MRNHLAASSFIALFVVAGCASVDPATNVQKLPPSALTISVESVTEVPVTGAKDGLRFAANAAEMQGLLVQRLRAVNAASRVVSATDAKPAEADIVLKLDFTEPIAMSHRGTSGFLASGGLWLVTWIGGLLVQDSSYNVKLAAKCALRTPRDRSIECAVGSRAVALSFLERNDFFSWSTLQSLVLPPFWTSDQQETTSAALTSRSMDNLAEDIAAFLKQDFEARALETDFCSVRLLGDRKNGDPVIGNSMPIELEVIANRPVKSIAIGINDAEPQPVTTIRSEQPGLDRHRAMISIDLRGLRLDADNLVRVFIRTNEEFTRTLRFGPRAG